ncbi:MAG: RHS repeat-associated core domain-containing protein [Leptospiraceae bacterium]|nr:RHS repeat-associated core domain-containing protein [Leptospiraceae bacterium]
MANRMNNLNVHQSPALRMEAWSINCLVQMALTNSKNRNLLTEADSLTAEQYYVLLYYRIILLILYACRNAQTKTYDESGNMETRATDTMTYNGQGKLKQIVTGGGDTFEYLYDSTGNRIRKKAKNSGVITYNFDGLYEITKTGSEGVPHTLYFKGLYGDVFAQMTRGDAVLRREDDFSSSKSSDFFDVASSSGLLSFAKGDDFPPGSFVKDFFCSEVAGSCSEYYLNTIKFYWVKGIVKGYTVVSRVEFRVGLWIMLIVMVYLLSKILSKLSLPSRTGINDDILESSLWLRASVAKTVTPLLTISILFTFTQCGVIGGDKSKNAPWMLLASGVNSNTASVGDGGYTPYGGSGSSGSGGGNSSLVPVTGMYFLHPDHLGSITMITDGNGNVVTGKDSEGKSHISYKPYGEILRTDSGGPDISKFKFTGQEEDKESGLMYYKARYYDPMIGRFLQADSVIMPESTFGMNRYMYVDGNPMKYRDPDGHRTGNNLIANLTGGFTIAAKIGNYKNYTSENARGGIQWAKSGIKGVQDQWNRRLGREYHKPTHILANNKDTLAGLFLMNTALGEYAFMLGATAQFAAQNDMGVSFSDLMEILQYSVFLSVFGVGLAGLFTLSMSAEAKDAHEYTSVTGRKVSHGEHTENIISGFFSGIGKAYDYGTDVREKSEGRRKDWLRLEAIILAIAFSNQGSDPLANMAFAWGYYKHGLRKYDL